MNNFIQKHERLIFGGAFALAVGWLVLGAVLFPRTSEPEKPNTNLPYYMERSLPPKVLEQFEKELRDRKSKADQRPSVQEEPAPSRNLMNREIKPSPP